MEPLLFKDVLRIFSEAVYDLPKRRFVSDRSKVLYCVLEAADVKLVCNIIAKASTHDSNVWRLDVIEMTEIGDGLPNLYCVVLWWDSSMSSLLSDMPRARNHGSISL